MDEPDLEHGSNGEWVRHLQETLSWHGHDPGAHDGAYSDRTHQAVQAFQSARGLTADGKVGSQTWAALKAAAPAQHSDGGGTDGQTHSCEHETIDLTQYPETYRMMFTETEEYMEYIHAVEEHGVGTSQQPSTSDRDLASDPCADQKSAVARAQYRLVVAIAAAGYSPNIVTMLALLGAIADLVAAMEALQRCRDNHYLLELAQTLQNEYEQIKQRVSG